MKKNSLILSLLFSLGAGFTAFSQNVTAAAPAQQEAPSVWFNPLFLSLFGVIVFLLVVILVLAEVIKGSAVIAKETPRKVANKLGMIALMMFMGHATIQAAETAHKVAEHVNTFNGLGGGLFYLMIAFIFIEIIIIIIMINTTRVLLGLDERRAIALAEIGAAEEAAFPLLLDKFNASVPLEQEADVLMDHEYDGIRELDNDLPPWWKYGFYVTIVFACIYIYRYHVARTGDLQEAEYTHEMARAEQDMANFRKNNANAVDETNVKLLTDKESLAKGSELFHANCAACHNQQGQGLVGPNLTDDYWLHGGSIKDVFKTIKFGYPEKGMKPWKDDFPPAQIAMIASYIKSLHGTNPPNPKEKQGELYVETAAPAATGTEAAKADSTKGK